MDLLRFLLLLPVRLVRGLLSALAWILGPLVGQVTWSAPGWMHAGTSPSSAFGSHSRDWRADRNRWMVWLAMV